MAADGKRLPELDGIRGTAILLVFLLHYVSNSRTNEGNFGLLYRFAQVFRLGWSGVDLFFVLSGFLIGGILLDARTSNNYFRTFYARRIHRILPVYYVWLLVYVAGGLAIMMWNPLGSAATVGKSLHAGTYFFFLQNIFQRPGSVYSHYMVSPTWSVAVEEQFYLLAPFLIRYLSRRRLTQFLCGCVVVVPILRYFVFATMPGGTNAIWVLMPCRADALAFGMLAAVAWRSPAKAWIASHIRPVKILAAVLIFGAMAMTKWLTGPKTPLEAALQFSWIAIMYTSVMAIALLDTRSLFARVTRWQFLRECGRVSYCFYLIHLGILGVCQWIFFRGLPRIDTWQGFGVTVLSALIAWTVAKLSWRYFEKPLIDHGHTYTYRWEQPAAPEAAVP